MIKVFINRLFIIIIYMAKVCLIFRKGRASFVKSTKRGGL